MQFVIYRLVLKHPSQYNDAGAKRYFDLNKKAFFNGRKELTDLTELINENEEPPKAVLVGLDYPLRKTGDIVSDFEHSMTEMKALIEACDLKVSSSVSQSLQHPESATYIGKGKAFEVKELIAEESAEYCIFEGNLTPAQMKNLQDILEVPVWDRTNLILEIFSRRAKTREARLQVESAYLQFMLPRLTGMWQHLGRQGGGSGSRSNKGIGETQLELDRRHINHRLAELSKELDNISRTRKVQRSGRSRGDMASVALVGYTNAGKSSLMNCLLSLGDNVSGNKATHSVADDKNIPGEIEGTKKVFEKDMLFATLDTSIRHISTGNKKDFLLSDTVGFIENLPHGLVKAFRSTLEEIKYADLLLIVLDASDPYHKQHRTVTEKTLKELGAGDIPRIYVMNKCDLINREETLRVVSDETTVYISAKKGDGISDLLEKIAERLYGNTTKMELLLPFSKGDILSRLHSMGAVKYEEYTENGIKLSIDCPPSMAGVVEEYISIS